MKLAPTTATAILALLFSVACGGSPKMAANDNGQAPPPESSQEEAVEQDIVDIAVGAGQFNTLVAALKAAELVTTLQGDGPFTVFAPTDDAFAKLPPGTVEAILKDKEKLTQILTYHVVSGKVMAADVGGLDSAKTLQGQSLEIDTSSGVRIGGATVVSADIVASNGVIHVIDSVLIPN